MSEAYPSIPRIACLNAFWLKVIAVSTMLVDHIGAVLFPGTMMFRYIGRIAFPIFVFLLVEGFLHTTNVRKYAIRLLIFALISEVPFDLAFYDVPLEFTHQNVFFTLLLGLLMLQCIRMMREHVFSPEIAIALEIVLLVAFALVAGLLRTDYSIGGVLIIYCFYRFRSYHLFKYVLLGLIFYLLFGWIELPCLLAVIPLLLYNGERGFRRGNGVYSGQKRGPAYQLVRYAFYVFYPVHLLTLHLIALAIR